EAPGALHYDIIRGRLDRIAETGAVIALGEVICIEAASTDTSTAGHVDEEDPQPGEGYYYLVQYFDGTTSSYGTESTNKPRTPGVGACGE
ncbi:MAG: hypothetical protein ACYSUI_22350, partial [Planctomycetota bacterium]